jgi:hypothetical protein
VRDPTCALVTNTSEVSAVKLNPNQIIYSCQATYPEKTKYMLVSWCQKAGQRQRIKIGNRTFEDVAKFKYLGTTLTEQTCIHEEIKSRLNSGNAGYYSVQSLLSSRLLSRNVKVKT